MEGGAAISRKKMKTYKFLSQTESKKEDLSKSDNGKVVNNRGNILGGWKSGEGEFREKK